MRIFEPITIRGMTLKNRIIMPPMAVDVGTRGRHARDYYAERARGGTAAITMPATFVDVLANDNAWGHPGAVAEFMQSIRPLLDAVHQAGAKIGLQLVHMSRFPSGLSAEDTRGDPIAPSPRKESDPPSSGFSPGEQMRELTIAEIETIISRFAIAAANVKKAGLDFVEFHSAHGYLPCQFVSPLSNRRNDRYGGNLTGRMRFGRECVTAMREAVGNDFPLFARIGAEEKAPGGLTIEEGVEYARVLEKAGADVLSVSLVDHVEISLPGPDNPMGCFAVQAERVKQRVSVPVMAVGRINKPDVAEGILAKGQADLIAIGRQLIADPHWVNKVAAGKLEDITPCISCNSCLRAERGEGLRCAVNAAAGREEEYHIKPAARTRKVLVVGGGPAGMEAARVAAQQGHQVTLYEKADSLGGQLQLASKAPHKKGVMEDLVGYLKRQLENAGVDVRLNSEVSAKTVLDAKPDVVIMATGATPSIPKIPGVDKPSVVTAGDVLSGRKKAGQRVVVIGGELVACDVAEFLAERGKKVTMLRRGPQMVTKMTRLEFRKPLLSRLTEKGVTMLTGVKYEEITDRGLVFQDSKGNRTTIEADTIVLATGAKPNTELAKKLKGKVAALYSIGDCVEPRRIREAIHDGARIAREI